MTFIARPNDLRRQNRRRVLTAIRRQGTLSRTDIRNSTGLSAATITAIVSELTDQGIIAKPLAETQRARGRGRPKVALTINPEIATVGTMVLKRNTISATIVDYAGRTVAQRTLERETETLDLPDIRDLVLDCMDEAIGEAGLAEPPQRIAVGVQGTTDVNGETMLWSPITPHRNVPIGSWLHARFKAPVRIWNDCDMIAQALHWHEPVHYDRNFAAVLLSYGVGMGLFQNGELMNGTRSSGMEFGHMTYIPDGAPCRCGRFGCIEAYVGDYAITSHALGADAASSADGTQNIRTITQAARNGDKKAVDALEAAGRALGTGLANLFALMDPFPVALVGSGAAAFEFMEKPLRAVLTKSLAGTSSSAIDISCFPDEMPIIHKGCAISALLVLDHEITLLTNGNGLAS